MLNVCPLWQIVVLPLLVHFFLPLPLVFPLPPLPFLASVFARPSRAATTPKAPPATRRMIVRRVPSLSASKRVRLSKSSCSIARVSSSLGPDTAAASRRRVRLFPCATPRHGPSLRLHAAPHHAQRTHFAHAMVAISQVGEGEVGVGQVEPATCCRLLPWHLRNEIDRRNDHRGEDGHEWPTGGGGRNGRAQSKRTLCHKRDCQDQAAISSRGSNRFRRRGASRRVVGVAKRSKSPAEIPERSCVSRWPAARMATRARAGYRRSR